MSRTVKSETHHPMKEGWQELKQSPRATLDYRPTPFADVLVDAGGTTPGESALRNDAAAAYAHALQWIVSGDDRYSAKAVAIVDAWSRVLRSVEPNAPRPAVQDELEVAWYAPIWLEAAEILRHCEGSGWSEDGITQFDRMVSLFKGKAAAWFGSEGCCPNQRISVALSRVAIGVYTEDRDFFEEALDVARATMVSRSIGRDGEVLEINRRSQGDCGHAAYNIEGLVALAEIAHHQGVDLYGHREDDERKPRLMSGVEYLARAVASGAQTRDSGFVDCTDLEPNGFEIAFNHFEGRLGMEMPQTAAALRRIRPVGEGTSKFVPWDTLTHGFSSA